MGDKPTIQDIINMHKGREGVNVFFASEAVMRVLRDANLEDEMRDYLKNPKSQFRKLFES